MATSNKLNLFYQEPDPDRWLPFDRYPRGIVRRIVRGQPKVGGHRRVFVNLCAGLDRLGVAYRVNDFGHLRRHPQELACVIGKPFLLERMKWGNPMLFGAAGYSHPIDAPDLLTRLPIKMVVVPGQWVEDMFKPYFGSQVAHWPVGIDTDLWVPNPAVTKDIDVLVYDKVRWEHEAFEQSLINPIQRELQVRKLRVEVIRYGYYLEEDFHRLLARSQSMVFLCEHETQGIAYQQALAYGVPLLAWDRGGFWQDPDYYPNRVQYGPVTSVPYWDERCGLKFKDASEFSTQLAQFWEQLNANRFSPRDYIVENLTLEKCAQWYLDLVKRVQAEL